MRALEWCMNRNVKEARPTDIADIMLVMEAAKID